MAVLLVFVAALRGRAGGGLTTEAQQRLLSVSAATIDRLLRSVRQRQGRPPRAGRPALNTLAAQVPIRTWGEWAEEAPGALQGDLVLHCGESTGGSFIMTLVGVATGWTELEAVWRPGQHRIGTAVHHIRERLSMALRAWHRDNDGQFINDTLVAWCRREGVQFTRGRKYRKNDQACVE